MFKKNLFFRYKNQLHKCFYIYKLNYFYARIKKCIDIKNKTHKIQISELN